MFGAYHTSVIRFLPTTILGISFAFMLYYSGSIIPSMICHCFNNALYVFEMYHPGALEKNLSFLFSTDQSPVRMVIIFVIGLMLAVIGGRFLSNGQNKKD